MKTTKPFNLEAPGRGKSRKERLALAQTTLPLLKAEKEETFIINPERYAAEDGKNKKSTFEKKVVEITAPEDNRYGHLTSKWWQAGYTILFDTAHVKYISVDFGDTKNCDVVVSKIVHPFGVRYYVSVPWKRAATSMLANLTDTSRTMINLLDGHSVGFMCKKGTEFAEICHKSIKLLQADEALTIAEVLRDIGNF